MQLAPSLVLSAGSSRDRNNQFEAAINLIKMCIRIFPLFIFYMLFEFRAFFLKYKALLRSLPKMT